MVWTITRATPTATTGMHRVYVNNVHRALASMYFPWAVTATNYIGKSHWSVDSLYLGSIDSLAFYPWVLSASDVQAIFGSASATVWLCTILMYIICTCIYVYMQPVFTSASVTVWLQCYMYVYIYVNAYVFTQMSSLSLGHP